MVSLPAVSFIAVAVFAATSHAVESSYLLMRDIANATELFEIANKDMRNWYSTYYKGIQEFHKNVSPDYICPDVSVRMRDITELEKQIEKIRECRKEKFEQLDVLDSIADTMVSTNKTDSLTNLKETIKHLNETAQVEDIELKKEEDEIKKLKETLETYICDCSYKSWGNWGSCSATCGDNGIKSRTRVVKWLPRNGGEACTEEDQQDSDECNRKCCPVDCTWEEWGDWSACPDKCGISKKFRAREKNEHICGGLACKGPGREEESCDRFAEVKMEKDQCHQSLSDKLKEIQRLKNKMCQNLDCKNGGTCQEGECLCTNEFTGRRCEEYILSDSIDSDPVSWIETDKIWENAQCNDIAFATDISLAECQRQCMQHDMCSAVNYSPTSARQQCSLRDCGNEVPPPLGTQGDYKGYYMDSKDSAVGDDAATGGDDAATGGDDAASGGDDAATGGDEAAANGEDAAAGVDDAEGGDDPAAGGEGGQYGHGRCQELALGKCQFLSAHCSSPSIMKICPVTCQVDGCSSANSVAPVTLVPTTTTATTA